MYFKLLNTYLKMGKEENEKSYKEKGATCRPDVDLKLGCPLFAI